MIDGHNAGMLGGEGGGYTGVAELYNLNEKNLSFTVNDGMLNQKMI